MEDNFEFKEDTHQYFLNGNELPSVSKVLASCGVVDTRWFGPNDAQRGRVVHRILELYDRGNLDWGTVDGKTLGWIDAYIAWLKDFCPEFKLIEHRSWHPIQLYGFTLDRLTVANQLVDIKSGQPKPADQLQLTAYREGLIAQGYQVDEDMICVHLNNNGGYKLASYTFGSTMILSDLKAWNACLEVYYWKTKHGVTI